jgi:phospholipid/cholesterol/gamma-HCH transport system permease protein
MWNLKFKPFESLLLTLGHFCIFAAAAIRSIFRKPYRFEEIFKQLEFVGNKSLSIIFLTGIFTGLALSLQIFLGFSLVGAPNLVGPTVALGIFRELGPVLSGLIVAARAGGAMAAQLGTMRVSEQIDAIKVMGVDPVQYLVGPRILASVISLPLLCGFFDFVAMLGSYILCVHVLEIDGAIYWDKIREWINPVDVTQGLVKAAFFGLIFSVVCTYRGYYTSGGAKGVGESTNRGVVVSMVTIIIADYVLTNFIRLYFQLVN